MLIDILFFGALIIGIIKGAIKGFIIGIFSLLGWMIGLAAAMKLSAVAALYLESAFKISGKWLPFISFLAVFIAVMLLVRLGAGLLEKTVQLSLMGWLNRLGGAILYALLYSFIFSVLLFFAVQLKIVGDDTVASSRVYPAIGPLGPAVIDGFGKVIPIFKDTFAELKDFFERVSGRLKPQ